MPLPGVQTETARLPAHGLETANCPVVIHFKDGRVARGRLRSSLLYDDPLRYCPVGIPGERRTCARAPLRCDVSIDRLTIGRLTDLSVNGGFVETLTPYAIGTLLQITIRVDQEPIQVRARVVFSDPGVGMGVEFTSPETVTRYRLDAALHQLIAGSGQLSRGRRGDHNRRTHGMRTLSGKRWSTRKRERREVSPDPMASPEVSVDLRSVKSVFFLDAENRVGDGWPTDPIDRQVTVEFRDGESIHGTLHEIPADSTGFFMALRFDAERSHTVYVLKSAVRSIQTIF